MEKKIHSIPAIILDADLRSQEGVIQSLGKHWVPIIAISKLKDCAAFHSKYVNKKYSNVRTINTFEGYYNFLENLPERGVIIYSDDVNAMYMSACQDKLKKAGFLINIPDFKNLLNCFDKYECSKASYKLNINYPKTELIECVDDILKVWDNFTKPVILKGTRLAGGQYEILYNLKDVKNAIRILNDTISDEGYVNRGSKIIVQEFLHYKMKDIWCCETVYSSKSKPLGHFTIQKIRPSFLYNGAYGSRMFAGESVFCPEIISIADSILSHNNWRGFAHLDLVYQENENRFYLMEVNPRLPGFSYYPSKAGYEMGYIYYRDLIGERVYPINDKYKKSYYFETFRFPGDGITSLQYVVNGYIDPKDYLRSYLSLLKRGSIKIIDPIRIDDIKFSIQSLKTNILVCCKWLIKKIIKKNN